MADDDPGQGTGRHRSVLARSPIPTAEPTAIVAGWQVTDRSSDAALRLADLSPLAKVHVRAGSGTTFATSLGVGFGEAVRDNGVLVTGSGPDEWTLIGPVGTAEEISARITAAAGDEHVTVVDLTHGRALVRLTGAAGPALLAGMCAIDLAGGSDGRCLRTSVAGLVTDIVRDDRDGQRSYLLHCERSSGAYLADRIVDAGLPYALEIEGFVAATAAGTG